MKTLKNQVKVRFLAALSSTSPVWERLWETVELASAEDMAKALTDGNTGSGERYYKVAEVKVMSV